MSEQDEEFAGLPNELQPEGGSKRDESLLTEELVRAYMGSDYHPSYKLTQEVKHGLERVLAEVKRKRGEYDISVSSLTTDFSRKEAHNR